MTSKKKKDPVRFWTFIVLALSIVLMVVYVVGDRLTPFTSQARVHAYVVPVAARTTETGDTCAGLCGRGDAASRA